MKDTHGLPLGEDRFNSDDAIAAMEMPFRNLCDVVDKHMECVCDETTDFVTSVVEMADEISQAPDIQHAIGVAHALACSLRVKDAESMAHKGSIFLRRYRHAHDTHDTHLAAFLVTGFSHAYTHFCDGTLRLLEITEQACPGTPIHEKTVAYVNALKDRTDEITVALKQYSDTLEAVTELGGDELDNEE